MRRWTEGKYGFFTLDTGLFMIHVGWRDNEHGYGYAYLRVKSKRPYWDIDECKWAAIKSAQKRIREAWERLK